MIVEFNYVPICASKQRVMVTVGVAACSKITG